MNCERIAFGSPLGFGFCVATSILRQRNGGEEGPGRGKGMGRELIWKAVHLGLVGDALEGPCVGSLVGPGSRDLSGHPDGE